MDKSVEAHLQIVRSVYFMAWAYCWVYYSGHDILVINTAETSPTDILYNYYIAEVPAMLAFRPRFSLSLSLSLSLSRCTPHQPQSPCRGRHELLSDPSCQPAYRLVTYKLLICPC